MQAVKKIKDPVYGYISIPTEYSKKIVDTAVFQRLRRVIQTSYSPLYSSALHNRFVHSIGVLHLGQIVAEKLEQVIVEKNLLDKDIAKKYANAYKIACLLHDVGHAPFSHTGEIYYKTDEFKAVELHERLCELVTSEGLKNDLPSESDSAAPHEIMSAIIGVKEFGHIIGDDESKELFVRSITGYKYKEKTKENEIKNCFISLLNSKVIDVDRLDYLIRDAYTSGFATISIDYVRLLKALTIVNENGCFEVAYQKDAVSVIENVVYAHDAERKWIQNHPVVLYEAYIIKHMLEHLNEQLNTGSDKLFSEDSLSVEGHILKNNLKISLMCDDDVIYLSKNVFPDDLSKEFFERGSRRHPAWKSEAEYNAYIGNFSKGGEHQERFIECMQSFNASKIPEHQIPMIINDELVDKLERNLEEAKKDTDSSEKQIKAMNLQLSVCRYLKNYTIKHNLPFDFIIIQTSMFNSNFSKKHLNNVLIAFESNGNKPKVKKLEDVCNVLQSSPEDKDFYYLFYRRATTADGKTIQIENVEKFCQDLYKAVIYPDEDN